MGHYLNHLPAAATATRAGGEGGRSGGPERIDFPLVVSVIIITFFLRIILRALPSPPSRPRTVRSGGWFVLQMFHMMGL